MQGKGGKTGGRGTDIPAATGRGPQVTDLIAENKAARKAVVETPGVVRSAVLLAWFAGRSLLVGVVGLSLLSAVLMLAQLFIIRRLMSHLVGSEGGDLSRDTLVVLIAFVGLTALFQLTSTVSQLLQRLLAQKVLRSATARMLDVTSSVGLEEFERQEFLHHLRRVEQNGLYKPMEVVQALVRLLAGGLTSILLMAFIATVDYWLIPMLLVTAFPAFVLNRRGGDVEFEFSLSEVQPTRERNYMADLLKSAKSAPEVRSFDAAAFFRGRWDVGWDRHLAGLSRVTLRRGGYMAAATICSGALVLAVALYIFWRVDSGAIPLASAGAAIVGLRFLSLRAQEAGAGLAGLLEARLYLNDLEAFTRRHYQPPSAATGDSIPLPQPERIEVDQVSYTYPGSGSPAIHNVSFEVTRGSVVALVGPNGSGKTTMSLLLSGLVRPTSGQIRWDDVLLSRELEPAVRRHVCVLFQDFSRYHLSAWDNISLGHATNSERVGAAVMNSGAGFLCDLPAGLRTMLSKEYRGGYDLSVGQWQRVALARAFHRDSPVVILDEPTSALDARAEHDLFEHLKGLWADRTVFVVSHRLANVRSADQIIVLDRGHVVDRGTHQDLIGREGLYSELYELQARDYRDSADSGGPAER